MSKAEVIDEVGEPAETKADGDKGEEYLIYRKMKHSSDAYPTRVVVTLRNGKVIRWGEQQ